MTRFLARFILGFALLFASVPALLPVIELASAATLVPNGEQTFVDGNGVPYAGGTVTMYIPSTTTFKTTWKDSAQTIPNTNPITLDAAGRAIIYGSGTYRQVLKDQFGATVWDQLTADTAGTSQSYAGVSTGSANVQILNGGSFGGVNGQMVTFLAGFTNSGPTTLNINGFGAVQVVKDLVSGPTALAGGEIVTGNSVSVVYDSVAGQFHMVSFPPQGGAVVATGFTNTSFTRFTGVITPTALAVTTNDWNPTNLGTATVIRASASVPNLSLNGIAAQPAGTLISLLNAGTNAFSLQPANTGSLAANRFGFQRAELLNPSQSILLWYDAVTSNWQLFQETPTPYQSDSVRETAVSGPTDAVLGTANFIPATSANLNLSAQNINGLQPLVISAASGFTLTGQTDYHCLATANPTWTGLTANTTNYLYLTVNLDGTCTPGFTVTQPVFSSGVAIGTGAGQYTFDTVHYQMWLGNGTIVNQVLVVFVGEATTGATTVTSAVAYNYQRKYYIRATGALPSSGTNTVVASNLGTCLQVSAQLRMVNVTTQSGYTPGQIVNWASTNPSAAGFTPLPVTCTGRGGLFWVTGASGTFVALATTTGANAAQTNANWTWELSAKTDW